MARPGVKAVQALRSALSLWSRHPRRRSECVPLCAPLAAAGCPCVSGRDCLCPHDRMITAASPLPALLRLRALIVLSSVSRPWASVCVGSAAVLCVLEPDTALVHWPPVPDRHRRTQRARSTARARGTPSPQACSTQHDRTRE